MQLSIRASSPTDAEWIESFLRARWGATTIVVHGGRSSMQPDCQR